MEVTVNYVDILHIVACYFSDPEIEADLPTMERLAEIVGYIIPGQEVTDDE
jgi:hypothetical protein